jgi:hypothetical protein
VLSAFSSAVCSFIETTIDSGTSAGALMKVGLGLDSGGSIAIPRMAGIGAKQPSGCLEGSAVRAPILTLLACGRTSAL